MFIHKGMKRRQRRTITGANVVVAGDGEHRLYACHFSTDCRTDRYKLTRIDDTRGEAGRSPIRETRMYVCMYDIVQHTNADRFNFTDPSVLQLQKLSHFTSRTAPHRITSSFLPRSQRRSNGRWNSIEPPNRHEGCRSPGIYLQNGATSGFEWPRELPGVSPNNMNIRQQPCTSYPLDMRRRGGE